MTHDSYPPWIAELRQHVYAPFNFIVPRLENQKPAIDICIIIRGRTQWIRYQLITDHVQLRFIANSLNAVL